MATIRIPHVNSFRDRHGRMRHYFRRPGCKAVALPGLPGSAEFNAALEAARANAGISPTEIGASRTKVGTLNAAIVMYYASPAFIEGFAAATRGMRRAILERWRTEDGEESLAAIRRHHIVNKLSPMKVHARKNWLKTIRGFMQFAVMKNMRADDPTHGIKFATGKSRGHMTWGEEQIAQFRTRHPIGTVARVAIELLLNIAARRHDAHLIGRQHLREGKLRWRPNKTLRTTGKMLSIRVLPELQAALDAIPANDSLTFLVTDYGKPFASAAAFGNKFGDWCDDAGLPEILCDDGRARNYRAHGLRKTACRRLAHAGCTASEIMAVSGHATLAQLQVYLDEVEQDIMADAAMGKLMRQVVGR